MNKLSPQAKMIISLSVFVIGLLILTFVFATKPSSKNDTNQAKQTTTSSNLVLSNANTLSSYLSPGDVKLTQDAVYTKIKQVNDSPSSTYTASVRDWSVRLSTINDSPLFGFMVDIPSLQQSYLVTVDGNDSSDFRAINVLCPTAGQLRYPAFNCQDSQQ